jgi:hypothetical protein
MPTSPMIHENRRNAPSRPTSRRLMHTLWALDKSIVASIPATLIEQMTREELLQMISVADVPLWRGTECDELLSHKDDELLRRMAYLARQCCQNQAPSSVHIGPKSDGIVEWTLS